MQTFLAEGKMSA